MAIPNFHTVPNISMPCVLHSVQRDALRVHFGLKTRSGAPAVGTAVVPLGHLLQVRDVVAGALRLARLLHGDQVAGAPHVGPHGGYTCALREGSKENDRSTFRHPQLRMQNPVNSETHKNTHRRPNNHTTTRFKRLGNGGVTLPRGHWDRRFGLFSFGTGFGRGRKGPVGRRAFLRTSLLGEAVSARSTLGPDFRTPFCGACAS